MQIVSSVEHEQKSQGLKCGQAAITLYVCVLFVIACNNSHCYEALQLSEQLQLLSLKIAVSGSGPTPTMSVISRQRSVSAGQLVQVRAASGNRRACRNPEHDRALVQQAIDEDTKSLRHFRSE